MFRADDSNPYQKWMQGQLGGIQQPAVPVQQAPAPMPQVAQQQAPQQQAALNQAIQGQKLSEMDAPATRGQLTGVQGGGTKGKVASNAMNYAGTGATIGSVIPGIGTGIGAAIGAGVGAIKGWAGKKAASAGTDIGVGDATNAISGAIREFSGREPNPGEVEGILAGQGLKPGGQWVGEKGMSGVLSQLQKNGEIQRQQQAAAAPQQTEQAAVAQAVAGPPAGGKGGILEGFSSDKMGMGMDKQMKSPKYAFAAVAQKYDQSDPAQRQAMLAELKQHPSGYFKNAQLTGNKGDILDVGETNDPVWGGIRQFDVIRAAGEGGKAWQWGARGGDSGGGPGGGGGLDYGQGQYSGAGDPVLAAINGQSLNPVSAGMARLQELLKNIPGGINGIANGGL
jgi:hypothetical protein